jgi:transposase
MLTALKAGTRYSIIGGVLQASLMEGAFLVPALPPYIIEPVWEQFRTLLPQREIDHPLGCHRPRISDRVVFEKLVQVLVLGCSYRRIADEGCSATTLRERRDEWIELGAMEALREKALAAYDRLIGLDLLDVAVDGCITKALAEGRRRAGARWIGASRPSNARWRWTLWAYP